MVVYVGSTKEKIQRLITEWEDDINRFVKVGPMDVKEWKALVHHLAVEKLNINRLYTCTGSIDAS